MSMGTAAARVPTRPIARPVPPPPRLRVVAPAGRRSASGLALLCITLLGGGLLALLMLNISIGKGAYELSALQQQQRVMAVRQQALAEQVEAVSAPQELAKSARALGMVQAPNTVFVNVPDGRIEGRPATAVAPPKPKKKVEKKAAKKAAAVPASPKATATSSGSGPKSPR
jgi:hypothetical protein